jgi:hypothetical protein
LLYQFLKGFFLYFGDKDTQFILKEICKKKKTGIPVSQVGAGAMLVAVTVFFFPWVI